MDNKIGGVAITRGVSVFQTTSSPIFLDNLACTGTESTILDCPRSLLGLHQCDHSQDAGLQCFGTGYAWVMREQQCGAIAIS